MVGTSPELSWSRRTALAKESMEVGLGADDTCQQKNLGEICILREHLVCIAGAVCFSYVTELCYSETGGMLGMVVG